jgi:2-phosphoglycerate kinase
MAIYLIGGPPKCGKTTLAKTLSQKRGISWISSDTLENLAWAYTSEEMRPLLFPHKYLRGDSNDEFYTHHSAEAIVQGYIEQSAAAYDAISMMVETYLTDEDDFIVEGYQVTPEIVGRIIDKFGDELVRVVFLIKRDEKGMLQDFHKSSTPNDWILRKTKDESTFVKIAHMIAIYSKRISEDAKKRHLPICEMDADFKKAIASAMEALSD